MLVLASKSASFGDKQSTTEVIRSVAWMAVNFLFNVDAFFSKYEELLFDGVKNQQKMVAL